MTLPQPTAPIPTAQDVVANFIAKNAGLIPQGSASFEMMSTLGYKDPTFEQLNTEIEKAKAREAATEPTYVELQVAAPAPEAAPTPVKTKEELYEEEVAAARAALAAKTAENNAKLESGEIKPEDVLTPNEPVYLNAKPTVYTLKYPFSFEGVEYREIKLSHPTAKKVRDFVSSDDGVKALPCFSLATGLPLTKEIMDCLSYDDDIALGELAPDFLPSIFRTKVD